MNARYSTLPPTFGVGWMSRNAIDLCRVMVALGGVDARELLAALPRTNTKLNTQSVERALAMLDAKGKV